MRNDRSRLQLDIPPSQTWSPWTSPVVLVGIPGVRTISMGKPEIPVENQMVHAILFGKRHKIWGVICGDAIFLFFSVCSADLDVLCSGSFSRQVKFYSFKFMHKIPPGWFVSMVSSPAYFIPFV